MSGNYFIAVRNSAR